MKKKKKNYLLIILVLLLAGISIGYAAFGQNLFINGTATAKGSFSLYFDSTIGTKVEPMVGANGTAVIGKTTLENDTLNINVSLDYPGAGAIVTATIKNDSTVPAMLNEITYTSAMLDTGAMLDTDTDILISDDIEEGTIIPVGGTQEVKITIQWNPESKLSITSQKVLNFGATLNYVQYTDSLSNALNITT